MSRPSVTGAVCLCTGATLLLVLQLTMGTLPVSSAFVQQQSSLSNGRSSMNQQLRRMVQTQKPLQVFTSEKDEQIQTTTKTTTSAVTTTTASTGSIEKEEENSFLAKLQEKIGMIDDDRIIYPEYDSGEVPRMFSALEYSESEQGQITAQHSTGSVVGAASLVAGTMVGAGILALPTATAPVGFLPSTVAMGVGWFYMTMSGLLIAELSINRLAQSGKPGQGLLDLFEDSLGPRWSKVGSVAYFFLHYTLLVAYIAQGGVNLDGALTTVLPATDPSTELVGNGISQIIFATLCAVGLYSASPAQVEKANSIFVLILSVSFLGIIGLGAQTADFSSLIDLSNQHPEQVPNAFPIIFLSLVYQNIVPTVVNQLEGDRTKITTAIIAGTTLPALMFVAWNAVVLGNVQGMDLTNLDPVALLQGGGEGSSPVLGNLVTTFSSLALVTSLIGFVYGLLDAWTDVLGLPRQGPEFDEWKTALFGMVFVPPLALALADPSIFYTALVS